MIVRDRLSQLNIAILMTLRQLKLHLLIDLLLLQLLVLSTLLPTSLTLA